MVSFDALVLSGFRFSSVCVEFCVQFIVCVYDRGEMMVCPDGQGSVFGSWRCLQRCLGWWECWWVACRNRSVIAFFLNTILRHRNCSKQFQYFSLKLFACGCYLILFPTYLSFLFVKFESFDHLFATKVICLLIPIMVCLFQCGSLLWHYWPCACGMLAMNPELTIGTVFYRFLAWLAW